MLKIARGSSGHKTHESIEDLYRSHANDLTRFAAGLVGPHEAGDVVSAAVARVLQTDWRTIDNPRAYLFRVVYNEATSFQRRLSRRNRSHPPAHAGQTADSPPIAVEVVAAMETLSTRERAVIVLTYWEDLPPRDVAERLGIGEGAVKKYLARARAKLRKELQ